MSRCFPYPPPGYEKSLALIESIKLQKGREKTEKERKKEKRREKKEKKDKSKGDKVKTEDKKHGHKKRHQDENEQLERSSLTEEHGCPVAIQNLYDSSDSTQNSSKRAKLDFSETTTQNTLKRSQQDFSDAVTTTTQNTVKKSQQDFSDTTTSHGCRIPTSSEQPCFSGRTTPSSAAPPKEKLKIPGHSTVPRPPSSSSGQPCFSGRIETTTPSEASSSHAKSALPEPSVAHPAATTVCESSSVSRRSSRARDMDRQYKKLIGDWTPPLLLTESPFDEDLDWLMAGASSKPRLAPPPLPAKGRCIAWGLPPPGPATSPSTESTCCPTWCLSNQEPSSAWEKVYFFSFFSLFHLFLRTTVTQTVFSL
ncbi:unnamed protein product [Spirodela intermedia]|uniref:Uncharacterized protein n=1 Tax=Spirodela intermedia TaxID=51605 RepID=A0A7I8J9F2_SPIIN|nr:unnamed protein product [Spirodela intermedia]CAA6666719.1 unnamed protein product [Spirodela intermedia]